MNQEHITEVTSVSQSQKITRGEVRQKIGDLTVYSSHNRTNAGQSDDKIRTAGGDVWHARSPT
jgi:hypothetical protein